MLSLARSTVSLEVTMNTNDAATGTTDTAKTAPTQDFDPFWDDCMDLTAYTIESLEDATMNVEQALCDLEAGGVELDTIAPQITFLLETVSRFASEHGYEVPGASLFVPNLLNLPCIR